MKKAFFVISAPILILWAIPFFLVTMFFNAPMLILWKYYPEDFFQGLGWWSADGEPIFDARITVTDDK